MLLPWIQISGLIIMGIIVTIVVVQLVETHDYTDEDQRRLKAERR